MSEILSLTPAAISRVNKLLQKENSKGVLRIAVDKSGCSGWKYVVDIVPQPKSDDEVIKVAENLAVYIAHDSIELLAGSILDCESKELGMWQWVFRNPKAKNICGCGESFTTKDEQG